MTRLSNRGSPHLPNKPLHPILGSGATRRPRPGERRRLDGAIAHTVPSEPSVTLAVEWSGPFTLETVLSEFTDGGKPPEYNGRDYGLYQIYGKHILNGSDTLLYVGKAIQQTFSSRFYGHREWLLREEQISIYLGRIYDTARHTPGPSNDWSIWARDVSMAECILIYKYSPNYNSVSISEVPSLSPYRKVILEHSRQRHRLQSRDTAPDDL